MKKVIKIVLISAVAIFGMLLMIGLLADDEETQVQNSNSASESENDEKKPIVVKKKVEERMKRILRKLISI